MPVISTIRNIKKNNENGDRNWEDTNKKWGFDSEKMMTFSRKRLGSEDDFERFICNLDFQRNVKRREKIMGIF